MKKLITFIYFMPAILAAQNQVYSENFAACSMPQGYKATQVNGNYNFTIARSTLFPRADASCSIFYLQTVQNDHTPRKFNIVTGTYKLFAFDQHTIQFGLRYSRPTNSTLHAYVVINGQRQLLRTYNSNVIDNVNTLALQTFKIQTPLNATNISLLFEYESAGADLGTNILIDNIFIQGADNDDCSRAVDLPLDALYCLDGNIIGAEYKGPNAACTGNFAQAVWYRFNSPINGTVRLVSNAGFNDVVSFFEGNCQSLKQIACRNDDEYGFGGEKGFYNVQSGKTYYFRIAKQIDYYGSDSPDFCVQLKNQLPNPPAHDVCEINIPLEINKACNKSTNIQAKLEGTVPSKNLRSRSDVWYSFTTASTKPLEIITNADFADVITVYSGQCNALTEVQCEDLGGKLILASPLANRQYFLQVSGYFSTIEGNVCVQVLEKSTVKPSNDDCPTARALVLNQNCTTLSTTNALKSGKKPSCTVYSGPDIWYSFVASAEAKALIEIQAGFICNYGLYSGNCQSLTEVSCGKNIDPCKGPIQVIGLVPGRTYYLQVIAASQPLRPGEGDICVSVFEPSRAAPYTPLRLSLATDCLHGVLGRVNYTATGGTGQIKYYGPSSNEVFYPGSKVEAFIEDANGCRDFKSLEINCSPPSRCKNSTLDIQLETICLKDSIGRQTGEVVLNYWGKGGSGVYYQYGTPSGTLLKHGDSYKLIIIDSDSCYVIEEGTINCKPFDCSQSNLKCLVSYECIDTLFKAKLDIQVTGALGSYSLSGTANGSFLSQGEPYKVTVTDQAGCVSELTGEINCKFDSCAYAQASLDVKAECLKDSNGLLTGKSVLLINGFSKAGNIRYIGNQPGDTLSHGDTYSVQLVDAFGCGLAMKGTVNCITVFANDPLSASNAYIAPNPTSGNAWLYMQLPVSGNYLIQTYALDGKLVGAQNYWFEAGRQQVLLNDQTRQHGVYYVKVTGKQFHELLRYIQQ